MTDLKSLTDLSAALDDAISQADHLLRITKAMRGATAEAA